MVRVYNNTNTKTWKRANEPLKLSPDCSSKCSMQIMYITVNVKLLEFFDQRGTLSTLQCGARGKRTTIDQLLSLEATVRNAQANGEQVVSIIFDMEKAYDLTWRYGILMHINEAGIEGRILNFIQNFLKPRYFKVEVNKILSGTKVQTEDIPQGSVVIPTFFILKMNKIVAQLLNDNRF